MRLDRAWIFVYSIAFAGQAMYAQPTQGSMQALNSKGAQVADCPLRHTTVKAEISGMARGSRGAGVQQSAGR